jgi:hypothetical protein
MEKIAETLIWDADFAREADRQEVLGTYSNLRLTTAAQLDSPRAREYAAAGFEPYLITLKAIHCHMWPFNLLHRIARGTYAPDSLVVWR